VPKKPRKQSKTLSLPAAHNQINGDMRTSELFSTTRKGFVFTALIATLSSVTLSAQTSPAPLPPNYKTTFENPDILVMHVHYGAHEFVPMHDHSAYPTLYVYLNDSGEVEIKHEGPSGFTVMRPPTHTGAFRISPGMAERHSVTSHSDTASDFLRVELKRIPPSDLKQVFRGEAPASPLPGTHTEFQDAALHIERVVCPADKPCTLPPGSARSLLIAIAPMQARTATGTHDLKAGDVLWLSADEATGPLSAGAQCLRVSLLYPN
jgi:hypothetical protein